MTIEFVCPSCGRRLTVPATFAGKKASCPECGSVAEVPSQSLAIDAAVLDIVPGDVVRNSTAASGHEPTVGPILAPSGPASRAEPVSSFTPQGPANWFLRTPERLCYGPVSHTELTEWVRQGRVTADCELRGEAESSWQPADRIFPALAPWTPGQQPSAQPAVGGGPPGSRRATYPPARSSEARRGSSPPSPGAKAGDASGGTEQASDLATKVPDRGILILTLGIVGVIVQCPVFSIMAWVMGTADVQEMRAGRMDLNGLTSTQWGRILGLIVSVLWLGLAVLGTAWCLYIATI